MILECVINSDCIGDSDNCVSNACFCGLSAKCSGRTDNCLLEKCKCGENDECPETEICSSGECRGMYFLILKKSSKSAILASTENYR